jgi:hypothetical protein
VNVAIAPKRRAWHGVLRSATALLKHGGRLLVVVPSVESAALIAKAEQSELAARANGVNKLDSIPNEEGIVSIEGVPTKHYSRTELGETLSKLGLPVDRIRKVEYTWRSQAVKPPPELRDTLPWDWLAIARKTEPTAARKAA